MFDYVDDVLGITDYVSAGGNASSGGWNLLPFLGDLWGTASNFAKDNGTLLGTLGAGVLSSGMQPGGQKPSPPTMSYGPDGRTPGTTGGMQASAPPPGTMASPLFDEGTKRPTGAPGGLGGIELDVQRRNRPRGGMGVI
jgi:hypothetical protein